MAIHLTMPALGESVAEGTVTAWLKNVGDTVEADEAILEISTDKVDSEVPSPTAGVLLEILVQEDETVAVGTDLAVIGDPSEAQPVSPQESTPAPQLETPPEPPTPETTPATAPTSSASAPAFVAHSAPPAPPAPRASAPFTHASTSDSVDFPTAESLTSQAKSGTPAHNIASINTLTKYVTPLVRNLAHKLNVDLAALSGTGIGGRIRREDVEHAAEEAAKNTLQTSTGSSSQIPVAEPSPLRGTTEKMTRLRQTIAKRMLESLQTSAQLTTVVEVDVTNVVALRSKSKESFLEQEQTKLTFLPFFVKAATEALLYHPKINATISDKEVTYYDHENIGIAVDTPRGLLVPVIKDAGGKSIADISRSINDLAARTRDSKIGPEELSGSTFTITNTGSGGALFDTPVLNMPETAILGIGTIVKRPMVLKGLDGNDTIGIRSMVYLALSYDHRLVDGGDAARYLMTVKRRLEEGKFEDDLH